MSVITQNDYPPESQLTMNLEDFRVQGRLRNGIRGDRGKYHTRRGFQQLPIETRGILERRAVEKGRGCSLKSTDSVMDEETERKLI
jgi:hypothetical protein